MKATNTIFLLLSLLACLAPSASANASEAQTEPSKAQAARLKPSSTADCNQQTWPIINAACLHSASNSPVQSVRIVSPVAR
jgi:Na+-transporting methylmalonyl-CoA/oxaloacetate decarboxylase gamma subunit